MVVTEGARQNNNARKQLLRTSADDQLRPARMPAFDFHCVTGYFAAADASLRQPDRLSALTVSNSPPTSTSRPSLLALDY
jgi:hypothetical protein